MRPPAWDESRDFDLLVVGDLNIDLILSGLPRIPEFGEEVLASGLTQLPGGSAANFAVCCARLGLKVAFLAKVGEDDFGDFLCERLEHWGVPSDFVMRDPLLATGITVSLSGAEDRAFVTHVGTIDSLAGDDVPADLLRRARHLHVASYFLQTRLQPGLPAVVSAAHEVGVGVSLDTGYDPSEQWDAGLAELLPQIDLFVPNEVEAQAITGECTVEGALEALSAVIGVVALKIGREGALTRDGVEVLRAPGFAVEVADTTCCGDAFNAGLVDGLLAGLPLRDALVRGNACGALMASVVGNQASVLTVEAVERMIASAGDSSSMRVGR